MLKQLRYNSREAAINDHKENYRSSGWAKGKFSKDGPDRLRYARIISPIPEWSLVLDIGCNDGTVGHFLRHDKGCTVYGLDVVDELVTQAQTRGLIARVGCAEEIPFISNKFQAIIMAEVMEHLFDPADGLREIHRVLRPDGVFVGSVPHPDGGMGHKHHNGGDYHQRIFETEELEGVLRQFFHAVTITPTPYNPIWCEKNNVPKDMAQWNVWECRGLI